MLEDPRKRQRIAFVTQKRTYERLVKKETFSGRRIIDEVKLALVAVICYYFGLILLSFAVVCRFVQLI